MKANIPGIPLGSDRSSFAGSMEPCQQMRVACQEGKENSQLNSLSDMIESDAIKVTNISCRPSKYRPRSKLAKIF